MYLLEQCLWRSESFCCFVSRNHAGRLQSFPWVLFYPFWCCLCWRVFSTETALTRLFCWWLLSAFYSRRRGVWEALSIHDLVAVWSLSWSRCHTPWAHSWLSFFNFQVPMMVFHQGTLPSLPFDCSWAKFIRDRSYEMIISTFCWIIFTSIRRHSCTWWLLAEIFWRLCWYPLSQHLGVKLSRFD